LLNNDTNPDKLEKAGEIIGEKITAILIVVGGGIFIIVIGLYCVLFLKQVNMEK